MPFEVSTRAEAFTLPLVNDHRRFVVDADVAEVVERYQWRVAGGIYPPAPRPFTLIPQSSDGWPYQLYHDSLITGAATGQFVRHINGNTLDCRRKNLMLVRSRGLAGGRLAHPPGPVDLINALSVW